MAKPATAFLVTDDALCTQDETGREREFKTEAAALKGASALLSKSCGQDAEVWVWKLSHVLSKPNLDPVIEKA